LLFCHVVAITVSFSDCLDLQARPVFSVHFVLAAFVCVSSFAIWCYFSKSPKPCFVVLANFGYPCYSSYRLDRVDDVNIQVEPANAMDAMPCTKNEALARWQFCSSQGLSCTFCALCISAKAATWCEMMIRHHTILQYWFTTLQVEPQEFQNMPNPVGPKSNLVGRWYKLVCNLNVSLRENCEGKAWHAW